MCRTALIGRLSTLSFCVTFFASNRAIISSFSLLSTTIHFPVLFLTVIASAFVDPRTNPCRFHSHRSPNVESSLPFTSFRRDKSTHESLSSLSETSQNVNKLKRSAFGKAAIGKRTVSDTTKPKLTPKFPTHNDSTTNDRTDTSPPDTTTSFSSPPVTTPAVSIARPNRNDPGRIHTQLQLTVSPGGPSKEEAQQILKKYLSMPLKESSVLLDSCPTLLTTWNATEFTTKVLYLLRDINIKSKQLRNMLSSHPRLMEMVLLDSEENITSTLQVLQTELDLSVSDIQFIQSKSLPAILNYNRSELRKRILVYKFDLNYNQEQIKRLVLKDPRMLRTDSKNVRQILQVLLEELDIRQEDVQRMIEKEILLLTYKAEDNIRSTIRYLKENEVGRCLGMVERKGISTLFIPNHNEASKQWIIQQRLKNLVMGHPKILSSSVERNLIPTVAFFLQDVGMTEYEFGRTIYRRGGSLLEANVERSLKRKLDFFRRSLDLEIHASDIQDDLLDNKRNHVAIQVPVPDATNQMLLTDIDKKRLLAQMFATNPDILTLSIESNLAPKFDYFTQYLGFSKQQLRHIVLKRPQLLALSLDRNIKPKIESFLAPRKKLNSEFVGLGMSIDHVRNWITEYPQTLTYTFESRILPRIRDVVQYDLEIGKSLPVNFIARSERSWKSFLDSLDYQDSSI